MAEVERGAPAPAEAPPTADGQSDASVDVRKLADKVYKLMLAEVRLERARQGGTIPRAKR